MADRAQLKSIFGSALEIEDAAERAAYLAAACQGNQAIHAELKRLLNAADAAGQFMQAPVVAECTADYEPIAERAGTVIGPYKLLQQIGEGGMGIVFMAEQSRPIQRTVALKIIKPGMDTRQVIARFEAERQALAMMDHPNIAKVLDAGTTESERPYFVMELVKGVPITRYCDERKLSLRERLKMLLPICHAVQHAHQKGVIHRDLKPSNVLVAEYDDQAVPKIIDFGVAKATAHKLTDLTMFTEFGQVVGTFEYMSPEQAKFNQLDIDTRSDIYSLGVLLYELLTGTTPFERKRLQGAALDEALRIIREEEPPKPSTKISACATLPVVAANRHTEAARLTSQVRGELDWIVMKALDKDRNRRYETANSLALDLQRYLDEEPVQAGPPSWAYKTRKLVSRNKRAMATAAVLGIVIATAIGVAGGTVGWAVRDRQARVAEVEDEIERALEQATAAYKENRVPDAIVAINRAEGLIQSIGANTAVRSRFQQVKTQLDAVQGINDIESRYFDVTRDLAQAETEYRQAIRLRPESSVAHASLSRNLTLQGRFAEAEPIAREAARLDPRGSVPHFCLGLLLAKQGKPEEAIRSFRAHAELRPDHAWTRLELGFALRRLGRMTEADQDLQEARRLDPGFDLDPTYWGQFFASMGRFWEAATLYREDFRADAHDLGRTMRFAMLLLALGERTEYESVCNQMIELCGKSEVDSVFAYRVCYTCLTPSKPSGDLARIQEICDLGIEKYVPQRRGWRTLEHRGLALLAFRLGKWQEAVQWSRDSRSNSTTPHHIAQNLMLEAMSLHHLVKPQEARQAYDEAIAIMYKSFPYAPHYLGPDWIDWLLFEPLRSEAATLLNVPQ
jgi:serine/threonine protein kinase/Flp pilus assembly protein TadD